MNTLLLKKSDLMLQVARSRGWANRPGGVDALSEAQRGILKDCLDSGLRNFYWPPLTAAGGRESYQWTFLTPIGQVKIESGTNSCLLPQDFDGFLSRLTISEGSSIFAPVTVIHIAHMMEMYTSNPTTSGRPIYAAERFVKGTTSTQGPRKELVVYPSADADHIFQFQYALLPECLTDAYPFAYGGQAHSETILSSCLAISEERYDYIPDGPFAKKFITNLMTSISRDRQHKPHLIGYNADHSDALEGGRRWFADYWQPVTYKGLPMESF